jgi:hypothetical protein
MGRIASARTRRRRGSVPIKAILARLDPKPQVQSASARAGGSNRGRSSALRHDCLTSVSALLRDKPEQSRIRILENRAARSLPGWAHGANGR